MQEKAMEKSDTGRKNCGEQKRKHLQEEKYWINENNKKRTKTVKKEFNHENDTNFRIYINA